jgi:hypothetical protein
MDMTIRVEKMLRSLQQKVEDYDQKPANVFNDLDDPEGGLHERHKAGYLCEDRRASAGGTGRSGAFRGVSPAEVQKRT